MLGKGTRLHRNGGTFAAPVWQELGRIVTITPPAMTREAIDVSYMNSPAKYKDYIAGLQEGGDMTVELHIENPAAMVTTGVASHNHHHVFADFTSGAMNEYAIEFPKFGTPDPDATAKWRFNCIITSFAVTAPVNEKLLATVTLKVVGEPKYQNTTPIA